MLAIALAIFLGSGQLMANQAAVSAALVATIQPPTHGVTFARFLDALAGGAIALLVNALVAAGRPGGDDPRAPLAPLLDELAATLDDVAAAIVARDAQARRGGPRARARDR